MSGSEQQYGGPESAEPTHPPLGYSTRHLLQMFRWIHLPPHLQLVSRTFAQQAVAIARGAPDSPERTTALRKLLESKDAAVRAVLPSYQGTDEELVAELAG